MAESKDKEVADELKQKARVLLGMSGEEFARTPPWKVENMLEQLGPSRMVAPVTDIFRGPMEIERLAAEIQCLKHSHLYVGGSTVKAAVGQLLANPSVPEEGKRLLRACQTPAVSTIGLQTKLADAIKAFIVHEEALDATEATLRNTYVKELVPAIAYFQSSKTVRDAYIVKFKRYLTELCDQK